MKTNQLIKKFFNKSFKNLESKKIFYKYGNNNYNYLKLKKFFLKFANFLEEYSNKRKKIAVISEKNFEVYSTIISIILTGNIWIPINPKLPKKRIENILKTSQTDILIINKIEQLKKLKILNFCKKNKIIFTDFDGIKKKRLKKINFSQKRFRVKIYA